MPADEAETHIDKRNMRTQMAIPLFLSSLLRRWVTLSRTKNVMVMLINQLREKPGVSFGNPSYTPGGKAIKFYCSVRAQIARVKGGRVTDKGGSPVGSKGVITNTKNKTGEGSREGFRCGFKIYFDDRTSEFMDEKEIKRED